MSPDCRAVVVSLVSVLAACGGESAGPSGDALPVSAVTGTWTISAQDPACAGGPLLILVAGAESDVQPFGSMNFATTWSSATAAGPLYGTVNLRTRTMTLRLVSSSGAGGIASLEGTLDEALGFTGRIADPYGAAVPALSAAPCASPASGSRTAE